MNVNENKGLARVAGQAGSFVEESNKSRKAASSAVLGSVAKAVLPGLTEVTVNCPLVTAKNRVQRGKDLPRLSRQTVFKYYRGYPTLLMGFVPYKAVMLSVNDGILSCSSEDGEVQKADTKARFTAGAAAGATAAVIACPMEQVMLQEQIRPEATLRSAVAELGRAGLKGYYRGFGACMTRDTIYAGSVLGMSHSIKDRLPSDMKEHERASTLLSGITAGGISGVVTQPLDTIKTVQQASKPKVAAPTVTETVSKICENGVGELWRGTVPRSARIALGAGIILGVKEEADRRFG